MQRQEAGTDAAALANAVAAAAEGYPFPTNLDRDQPIGGLTPLAQTEILGRALAEDWEPALVDDARRVRTLAGERGHPVTFDGPTAGELRDKVVLVSGGFGRGGRRRRAAVVAGASVVVTGRRADVDEAAAAELRALGGEDARFVPADITDVEQARGSVHRTVEAYPGGSTAW